MFVRIKKSPNQDRHSFIIVHNFREPGKKNCSQKIVKWLGTTGDQSEHARLLQEGQEWITQNGAQWIATNCPPAPKTSSKDLVSALAASVSLEEPSFA